MTTTRRRVVVAVNPSAAFGTGGGVGSTAIEALTTAGHEVVSLTASSFAELAAAAQVALAAGADALVVVGGDGMVSLGANLVATTPIPLGIVPSGTGNDCARGLGIPVGNTEAAVRLLIAALEHDARTIDAGRVTRADGG